MFLFDKNAGQHVACWGSGTVGVVSDAGPGGGAQDELDIDDRRQMGHRVRNDPLILYSLNLRGPHADQTSKSVVKRTQRRAAELVYCFLSPVCRGYRTFSMPSL